MANRILHIVLASLFVAYPFLIYLGLTQFSPSIVSAFILTMLGARLFATRKMSLKKLKALLPLSVAATIPALFSLIFNSAQVLLLMPTVVNATLFCTFGWTLLKGPSMIARFAAISEPVMTDRIHQYCRKVTVVWCLFFIVNGTIATYTAFCTSKEYWTLYNGLISYILIGVLLGTEFLIRQTIKKKKAN
ncbi:MAG: hypothetical protein JXR76_13320 [Deltaproteobacteria bacterium]|nr:hypothetical protein [Deltaproteobacteria bacterium]